MRKIFLLIFSFSLFFLPQNVFAASCETGDTLCVNLSSCTAPCVRVITRQGGGGGRGGGTQAMCACKLPNPTSSVPLGGACTKDEDCAPPGKFCWGGLNQPLTCHTDDQVGIGPTIAPIPIHGSCGSDKIYTAIGCIPVGDFNDFIGWMLNAIVFIATGVAFLLMAFGAIQIITSAGSPDKVKAGQELITSALSGLVFILLSLLLLRLIGVDILHIPGF